jgi:putative ABC transport system permease protein
MVRDRTQAAIEAVYRLLLAAQPQAARRRYGDEMLQTFRERSRAARRRGRRAWLALLARELGGLPAAGLASRISARRRRLASRPGAPAKPSPRGRPRPGFPLPSTALRDPRLPGKGSSPMDSLLQDLRYAVRMLAGNPGFTAVAVLALGLGIGANTAIYSVVHAVILEPLPFAEPDRLLAIWERNPERGWDRAQVAAANYLDWREQATTFIDMGAHNDWLIDLPMSDGGGDPEMVFANEVTGNLFAVLGVEPAIGSGFEPPDTWEGGNPKVLLAHAFWERRFAADPGIVGAQLELGGVTRTVVGVMPPGFTYPLAFRAGAGEMPGIDAWVPTGWPLVRRQQISFRRAHGMSVVGRLRDGVTIEEAASELDAIAARLEVEYPATNVAMGTGVTPLHEWVVGDHDLPLLIMLTAVGFVLLIACANVANMLLARATTRRAEMAVRQAMGASRARLLRQGLTESVLLSGAGGLLGIVAASWGIQVLLRLGPELPRLDRVGLDLTVLGFTAGAILLTGLVFGAVPAWKAAARGDATPTARGASAGPTARHGGRLLVAAEVALALPLVIGAGLMFRTLVGLQDVDPGFDPRNTLVAEIQLPSTSYPDDTAAINFWSALFTTLEEIPGVESAAMSSRLPFRSQRWSSDFSAEGWEADRFGTNVRHDEISPGFFETMKVPIVRGRAIDATDRASGVPVVVINQALADRYFADRDPIGVMITFDRVATENSFWRQIVGVAANVRREHLALEEQPGFYAPVLQDTTLHQYVLLRTAGEPTTLAPALRERVRALDAGLPIYGITTFATVHAEATATERFLLTLLGAFAFVGLALAAVGIYGVISYTTSRRTREIGIRLALGARGPDVVRMIVGGGMAPVLAGIAVGAAGALAVGRVMSSLLFGVTPYDPWTFAAVIALLAAVALLACVMPARRATRLDAATALRND